MSGRARSIRLGASILGGAVLVAVTGTYLYLRSSVPDYDRDVALAGLAAPVVVHRDRFGVPYVHAASERDLARATGYLHAQDRLWQMELFRRTADGRLAEIFGPELVETDRFLRTIGLGAAAERSLEALPEEERSLLDAYVDGVNAWTANRRGALPLEFLLLRLDPEPWTLRNTLSVAKLMAWDLADWRTGTELQRAREVLGEARARELHPRYPDWGPTTLPGREPADEAAPPAVQARTHPSASPPEPALAFLARASAARGSNAWAVGGDRTRSGRPILAGDMHLSLSVPSLWYLAALKGGEIQAAGMTIPGSPYVVSGHTGSVAWAFTFSMISSLDFTVERLDPEGDAYRYAGRWLPLDLRDDTIRVRGGEPVVHRVRSTHRGPLVTDALASAGSEPMSMRWAFHGATREAEALRAMNAAATAEEMDAAASRFDGVNLNLVYADTLGAIGYRLVGRIEPGEPDLFPASAPPEGAPGIYLEPEALPSARLREGALVSANHRITRDGGIPLPGNWASPYRAMRIEQLIARADATYGDHRRAQTDTRDLFAARTRIHAARAARRLGEEAIAEALARWDGSASADSRAAAVFYAWLEGLRRSVSRELWGEDRGWLPRSVLDRMLNERTGVLGFEPARLDSLSREAMARAVVAVSGLRWGELHRVHMTHPLSSVPLLDRLFRLDFRAEEQGGSPHSVMAMSYRASGAGFSTAYGPSQRHVVELGDPENAGFILPTGQSGNPLSRHYRDQFDLWRRGELIPLPTDPDRAASRAEHRAVFRPIDGPGR